MKVLRIFLLVNPWNRNRLRTFLEKIVFGKTLFTLFVISVNLYLLSVFTQRKIFPHRRVHWCKSKRRWTLNRDWERVIFSDETQVVVDSSNRVYNYVRRRPDEVWRPECLGFRGNCKLSAMSYI
jgi:hypothetical protein